MTSSETDLDVAWRSHVSDDLQMFDRLMKRLREKHRRYHTASHVAWVIRHIEELAQVEPVDHHDEIIAAAFYHDAIYEPTHPANERASARLARRDLTGLGWSEERVERVAELIEATEHGATTDGATVDGAGGLPPHDTAILVDADLAILGADPATYANYVSEVRSEYRHVDDEAWRDGRTAVLRGFLDRPAIFSTPTGRARWESDARVNISAELAGL
jgi:predicted metal-dependent HD superfamily phosphohydrolase